MRLWLNKHSAELVLATEQWEPLQVEYDEKFYESILPEFKEFTQGRKVAKGFILQVGWLVQNRNDVWFGLPMSAQDQFEDMGEL